MSVARSAGAVIFALNEGAGDREAHQEAIRIAEALIFAAPEPMTEAALAARLPSGTDIGAVLADLGRAYAGRGINLVPVAGGFVFRTASDVAFALAEEGGEPRKLSRAAMEVLAIIAYHQPATRAEIEEIRGVSTSKGTLDVLLETRWIRMRGRRKAPGRPVTYGTTAEFLAHFGLDAVTDLPGLEELQGLGMLDKRLPSGLTVPSPADDTLLHEDEEPLDPASLALGPEEEE